jgi:Putative phage abortive infection protein
MNSKVIESNSSEPNTEGFDRQVGFIEVVWFVLAGAFVFLILAYWYSFSKYGWSTNPDAWGQFGDFLGGVLNPLVSLAALFALVISVRMQRAELRDTRSELIEAKNIAADQAETAEKQRRQQRFFDLLNLYQNTSEALTYPCNINTNVTLTFNGKAAISEWLSSSHSGKLLNAFNKTGFGSYPEERFKTISLQELEKMWRSAAVSDFVSPYIRTVFNILAEAESIFGNDHERYILFFRNQFSNSELFILCCHIYLDSDIEQSRDLAGRYELLKHLPQGKLREETEKMFSLNVFGKQRVLA